MGTKASLCILTNGLGRGGAEAQLTNLALHWRESGRDVVVVSLTEIEDPRHRERLDAAAVPVVRLGLTGAPSLPGAVWRLLRLLRRECPDVLVSFMYHANVLGRVVGRLAGVPRIVTSFRNEDFGGRGRDLLLRSTRRLDHAACTNAESVAASLAARGIVRKDAIRVVRNALAPAYAAEPSADRGLRDELGVGPADFLWLCVGSLTPQKAHADLLRAMAGSDADSRLALAGDGPLAGRLVAEAERLGLADRVLFLGQRDDVPELLAAADGFVLASTWEGSPNVVLEALASGVPVVATRVGGVPELLGDGKAGILAPSGEPEGLRAAMARVEGLELGARSEMGMAGRRHVLAHHGAPAVMAAWDGLLLDD